MLSRDNASGANLTNKLRVKRTRFISHKPFAVQQACFGHRHTESDSKTNRNTRLNVSDPCIKLVINEVARTEGLCQQMLFHSVLHYQRCSDTMKGKCNNVCIDHKDDNRATTLMMAISCEKESEVFIALMECEYPAVDQ